MTSADLELTELERAALDVIGKFYASDYPDLMRCLEGVRPTARENTGGGFFTQLAAVDEAPPLVTVRSPLGIHDVAVAGMTYPLGFLLFFKGGRPTLLEGYAAGPDDTKAIDFTVVSFGEIKPIGSA